LHQLAEVNESPRIKLSEDLDKVTMPGRKDAYRLFGADGHALVDLLQQPNEPPVIQGTRVLCRHPFQVYLVVSGHVLYLLLSIFFLFFFGIAYLSGFLGLTSFYHMNLASMTAGKVLAWFSAFICL